MTETKSQSSTGLQARLATSPTAGQRLIGQAMSQSLTVRRANYPPSLDPHSLVPKRNPGLNIQEAAKTRPSRKENSLRAEVRILREHTTGQHNEVVVSKMQITAPMNLVNALGAQQKILEANNSHAQLGVVLRAIR